MAQQINQLALREVKTIQDTATAAQESGASSRRSATPGPPPGGRDELYKCINQLATKIAERSLPLFMGETGGPNTAAQGRVKKSPTLENASNSSRQSLVDEQELDQPPQLTTIDDSTKFADSPTGSASQNSPDLIMSAATLARADPGLQQDSLLALRDKNAVDFIFNRGKNFSKFIVDFIKNEEKRINSEIEHIRALSKNCQAMATSVQPNQTTQSNLCMPLQAHLINYSKNVSEKCRDFDTRNYAQCSEELDHLKKKNNNFDNKRKSLKDQWKDQLKKTADSRTHHEKAKGSYVSRCQALEKLRADEADITAQLQAQTTASSSSDSTYGSSGDVNDSPAPSSSSSSTLSTVGPGGTAYGPPATGQTSSSAAEPASVSKMRSKVEKLYRQRVDAEGKQREAEEEYKQAVFRLNDVLRETEEQRTSVLRRARELNVDMEFVFKQTNIVIKKNEMAMILEMQRLHSRHTEEMETYQPGSKYSEAIEVYIRPRKEEYQMTLANFEPYQFSQGLGGGDKQKSVSELVQLRRNAPSSKISTTHRSPPAGGSRDEDSLDGLNTPGSDRVSGGRSSVYSGQSEYEDGTVGTMKSALNEWASNIKNKLSIKSRRSGAPGEGLVEILSSEQEVKHARYILYRCISEIEERGLRQTGLYRCSASVRSILNVMENLQVEGPTVVDLSDESIYTLCGAIKSALKGLSEPLLTYDAYPEFLEIGKEAISSPPPPDSVLVARLGRINDTLPEANKMTCGILFHHLRKVSTHSAENQMTAANLGTCLSPTLLKPKSARATGKADVGDMMDNPPRSRVIELLITHVEEIFGPRNEYIPELDFSCSSPTPGIELPDAAPNSAPPIPSESAPTLAAHPPAVRSASDGPTRIDIWPTSSALRPGAVSSCSSRSSDSTDLLSVSQTSSALVVHPSANRVGVKVPQLAPVPPKPLQVVAVPMKPLQSSVGPTRGATGHSHHQQGASEPSEIAFIDNDDSAGEDLGHSGEYLSSSGGGTATKKNLKKGFINLFRKRKHDDLPTNGHLKSTSHTGRSLEQLATESLVEPSNRQIDRVASVHIPVSSHSDESDCGSMERLAPGTRQVGRRRSVTRLGRTEGDGHSTPTSPVVTLRHQPVASAHPPSTKSSTVTVELRRSSPAIPPPSSSPADQCRIRRRRSDNLERSQEARALVRDRHRAAMRQSPSAKRDRSCPATQERRKQIQSTPPSVNVPPKIRSSLEPRRLADKKVTRCQFPVDDYRDAMRAEAKPLEGGGNLTPRRSHPEFV